MARASVRYIYSTGEAVLVQVECDAEHPDAQDQVATRTRRLFDEVMTDLREHEDTE